MNNFCSWTFCCRTHGFVVLEIEISIFGMYLRNQTNREISISSTTKPCILRQNVQEQKLFKIQFYLYGDIFRHRSSVRTLDYFNFQHKPCVLRQNVQEQKLFKIQFYLYGDILKAVISKIAELQGNEF